MATEITTCRPRPIVIATRLLGIVFAGFCVWFVYDLLAPREALHEQGKTRGNAIVVALNSYKRDHGEYPKDLNALVPAYLPEVLEPFKGAQWEYTSRDEWFLLVFRDRGGFPRFATSADDELGQWSCDTG